MALAICEGHLLVLKDQKPKNSQEFSGFFYTLCYAFLQGSYFALVQRVPIYNVCVRISGRSSTWGAIFFQYLDRFITNNVLT